MRSITRWIVVFGIFTLMATGSVISALSQVADAQQGYATNGSHGGFNDEYVFAATRGLNDMEGVHPAFKVPLFPVTVVLDTAFLPFAVIAGFVT